MKDFVRYLVAFVFCIVANISFADAKPESIFEIEKDLFPTKNQIDEIVLRNLKAKQIKPSYMASESVMLRRVYLDLTGTIPTKEQAKAYYADKSPNKYNKLVSKLLESDDFNIYLTMRLGDILRVKSEFPINLWPNAAQAYTRYIYSSIAKNKPWNVMVREMLTSSGSNFRVGQVNFYRAMQARNPQSFASCVSLSFMGMRFERFTEKERQTLIKFFESVQLKSTKEWKEEIVMDNPLQTYSFDAEMPDGSLIVLRDCDSPRKDFAEWLTSKNNPYFAKVFANRVWTWLVGTPIVSPVDDLNGTNLNPELLEYLAKYFSKDFDIRKLFKHIVLSRTYAASSVPRDDLKESLESFATYKVRQLEAEVIIDMICKITDTGEIYESATPEPYTLMPLKTRAVSLYDSGITTSFLEMFGRSPRDTGYASERVSAPSASQRLHLLNSSHIRRKLEDSSFMRKIIDEKRNTKNFNNTYLHILSRYPTPDEIAKHKNVKFSDKYSHWHLRRDVAWALINSEEFLNRH